MIVLVHFLTNHRCGGASSASSAPRSAAVAAGAPLAAAAAPPPLCTPPPPLPWMLGSDSSPGKEGICQYLGNNSEFEKGHLLHRVPHEQFRRESPSFIHSTRPVSPPRFPPPLTTTLLPLLPILINLKTLWETTWSEGGSFQVWEKEGRPKFDTSFPGRRSDTFLFSFSLSFSFIHPEVTIRWVFFLLLSKLSSFPKQRKDFGPKRQREREPAATVKGILI